MAAIPRRAPLCSDASPAPPSDPHRARRRRHGAAARRARRPAVPLGRPAQRRRARTAARRTLDDQAESFADDFNRELTRAFFWLQVGAGAAARRCRSKRTSTATSAGIAAAPRPDLVQDDLPAERAGDREGRLARRTLPARPGPPRASSLAGRARRRSARSSRAGARGAAHGAARRPRRSRRWPACRPCVIPRDRGSRRTATARDAAAWRRPAATPSRVLDRGHARDAICCRSSSSATSACRRIRRSTSASTARAASPSRPPAATVAGGAAHRARRHRRRPVRDPLLRVPPLRPDRRVEPAPARRPLARRAAGRRRPPAPRRRRRRRHRHPRGRGGNAFRGRGGPAVRAARDRRAALARARAAPRRLARRRGRRTRALRNLLVSFGVLLLLGASMGLVLVTTGRARRLAAQQMEFVAGVSHELRTPLAVIRSAAENLADGIVADPKQVKRYGDVIAGEGRRLTQMVEQIMEFAGFESGRATLDVRPGRSRRHHRGRAARRRPARARAPRDDRAARRGRRCRRCSSIPRAVSRSLQNLIVNALKYGGAPPPSWLEARPAEGAARGAPSPSADNGAGIAARDLPHIFEPFYRGGDATARQIHGSGLGLSLVKRIMDELGGRDHGAHRRRQGQRVHAAPAAGPRRRAGRRAGGPPARDVRRRRGLAAQSGAHGVGRLRLDSSRLRKLAHDATDRAPDCRRVARILIVEDEPGLVLTLTDRLGREGHGVESAQDGRDGPEPARSQEPFDLLLLDVMLPGQSGFDVLRDLRQQGVETPVIMLTARGQVVDKVARPQARRRRLPHQAVRDDGAAGAHRGAAAARRAPKDTVDAERLPLRRGPGRLPQGGGHQATGSRSSSRRASTSCCATSSSTAARRSHATSCSTTCGATTPCRTRAPSTSTWRGCGRRSSPIPKHPQYIDHRARPGLQVRGVAGDAVRTPNCQTPTAKAVPTPTPKSQSAWKLGVGSALGVSSWKFGVDHDPRCDAGRALLRLGGVQSAMPLNGCRGACPGTAGRGSRRRGWPASGR